MKKLPLITLLLAGMLWCAQAHAAIARDGTVGVVATSGTFSGTAAGSLKIVLAFHKGGATIPTLPAAWTSIATGTFAGTTGWQLACNDSSSSADTGTGIWTNATDITGASYSGTAVTSTAACKTSGLGGLSAANNSSTTISYNTITMTKSDGTSWVVGMAGCNASLSCKTAPTLMTNEASAGASESVGAHDTNAGVTSWSTTTVANASGGAWNTEVMEVLAGTGGGATAAPMLPILGAGD